jgi:uncharacterized membrane protein (UPF0136 family)
LALPGALTNKIGGLIQGLFPRRCYVSLMAVMWFAGFFTNTTVVLREGNQQEIELFVTSVGIFH